MSARFSHATMPPAQGSVPDLVAEGFREGLFDLPAPSSGLGVSAVRPMWRIPVILISFADDTVRNSPAEFDFALFDSTGATPLGSVYDYYQWVSQGRLAVRGRVVASVHLPYPRSFYGYNSWGLNRISTPNNSAGMVTDALLRCDTQVRWADFDADRDGYVDMLWVVHAGIGGESRRSVNDLWSITSALNGNWNSSTAFESAELQAGSSLHMRIDRFSILPAASTRVPGARCEIGVYCHEFGHALGLPDLYNTQDRDGRDAGPGHWSLMATGGNGGDGITPETPVKMGAWEMLFLGWAGALRPSSDTTLVLSPIGATSPVLDLQFEGEPAAEHYIVESRRRQGFDRNLPGEGLVVYHVDEGILGRGIQSNSVNAGFTPGLKLVEADGHSDLRVGADRGGPGDPFPGLTDRTMLYDTPTEPSTRTFIGAPTSLGLFGITPVPAGVRVTAQVRPPGWLPRENHTEPGYEPIDFNTPATRGAVDETGSFHLVESEVRAGHVQIVLRERVGQGWLPGYEVSQTPADAIEPALALLPGGDLAVAWSDARLGHTTIWYRARVRGVWTREQLVVDLPGDSRSPAIAVDPRGAIHLTWLLVNGVTTRLMFMRFPYLSPYGQPAVLTAEAILPANPSIATDLDGGSYVMWAERSENPAALMFMKVNPDSALRSPQRLGAQTSLTPTSVGAQVEGDGTFHAVWLARGSGLSEIHYQRRPPGGPPAPGDSVIESRGGTIQSVQMMVDGSGGVHVVFENSVAGVDQVRYKRRHPSGGWDARSTEITPLAEGGTASASVFAQKPGEVTVVYTGYAAGGARFMERRRQTDSPASLDAPPPAEPRGVQFRIAPNPLRAGRPIVLRILEGARTTARLVDFFDLSGRRIATAPLEGEGFERRARLSGVVTAGWSAGVYFARLREPSGDTARIVVLR